MGNSGVVERVKVREVTGVFPSRAAIIPAIDDLLLAGFDRADIDAVAEGERLRNRIGGFPVPAVELADLPEAPRQEFVAPEDTAAIFALCVGIMICLGAMVAAISAIASGGTVARIVVYVIVGAALGCCLGILIARYWGWRWTHAPAAAGVTDGLVIWVYVRTPDREREAQRILRLRGAEAVHVHEMEIAKRIEDIPLSSLRPDPWLGDERLGTP